YFCKSSLQPCAAYWTTIGLWEHRSLMTSGVVDLILVRGSEGNTSSLQTSMDGSDLSGPEILRLSHRLTLRH
ncbi:hypothetical protein Pmar_PMAR005759, partial [Perkinsus marinus ATCC 50983]